MDEIPSEILKSILHSKRANIYYLEHCRVLVNGGRVEYITEDGKRTYYWNIPIANTTSILLGSGTSITQAAMRELARAGVLVGFCGGGGTPLFAGNEAELDISWLSPQSEYRPTEYLQAWIKIWIDETLRLQAAKLFQKRRLSFILQSWSSARLPKYGEFRLDKPELEKLIDSSSSGVDKAKNTADLLSAEAQLTKELYKLASKCTSYGSFVRAKKGTGHDPANKLLDNGNYLAYGLAATATWVLGLPHGLSILHGKTRRGGLVFDVADIVKDALILPQAFLSAQHGLDEIQFRHDCVYVLTQEEALDIMIETIKNTLAELSGKSS